MTPRITLLALTLIASLIISTGRASATFPGRNGRIALVQGPDIFTMNPDGSDVRQLTNLGPDSGAFWQSWSPDGKQIVFNEFRPPDFLGQLWLMNADGSNQHLLLVEPDFHNERPSFTPDGGAVIFTRCRLDVPDTCALYQIHATGGGLTAITNFELGITERSPKYSANKSLAFISVARGGILEYAAEVARVQNYFDSGGESLVREISQQRDAASSTLEFENAAALHGRIDSCAIYLTADSESGLSRITPAALWAHLPDWSPDGRRIAFSTHCQNPQNEEIWVVDVGGAGLRRLTKNGNDYFAGPHDFSPSWSPQGDAIVFERDSPDFSSFSIVVMKADGSGSRRLLTLRPSAQTNRSLANRIHGSGRGVAKRRLKQIEEGGALPQWGVAPH